MRLRIHTVVVLCSVALAPAVGGCGLGLIDGAAGPGDGHGGKDPSKPIGTVADSRAQCKEPDVVNVAPAQMRRLSRTEYDNTLRDLGLVPASTRIAESSFASDELVGIFAVGGTVDDALARDILDGAMTAAEAATGNLAALTGCSPGNRTEEDSCAHDFVRTFGRRAYRHALSTDDASALDGVYTTARNAYDFKTAIQTTLVAMLSSPDFLYLFEEEPEGTKAGAVLALSSWDVASRLSYFLWDSTPDEALLDAAESDALKSPDGIETQARRMLDDPRAHAVVDHFFQQWSGLEDLEQLTRDTAQFPDFTDALPAELAESMLMSDRDAVWSDGGLEDLFNGNTVHVTADIAALLGVEAPEGDAWGTASLPPDERAGILTHPAFLAANSKPTRTSPIMRGVFVRRRVLCGVLPDPPAGVNQNVAAAEPGISNRERFAEHTASAACSGCHTLIDPIGFGFENYDALGKYRTKDEGGETVDASGEIVSGGDTDGTFVGAIELGHRLAESDTVSDCMALQWFRFALDRAEGEEDACSNASILNSFLDHGKSFPELFVAITRSDAFSHRRAGGITDEDQ